MPVPIIIENEPAKPLDATIADYAGTAELGGYTTQLIPSPWTRIGGGVAALLGGIGRTWGNYSAGRLPIGSALIETVGDIGFPLVGIFAPQLGQARALKALQAAKAAENATKGQKAMTTIKNAGKAVGRFGVNTGTNIAIAGAANYGLPGMVDSGTFNPMYGVDYLKDDLRHVTDFESPGARTRLFTTFGLPMLLPRLSKYNVKEDLKSPANATETPRTTTSETPRTTSRSQSSKSTFYDTEDHFFAANPKAPAILIGLGAASAAKAQSKNNNKSSNWLRRLRDTPKTITGTYTGKPIDTSLTKGLIIGRKNGGLLKELRK